ncbi:palmitoyl-protein thioesterase [Acrasis kona]|uniref:palmitoyl-CoA hydrolase n=1 Tax=Acrasis kona TaxID=1008807 RepID=A0AAW2ZDQ2_9EUKA
MSIKVVLCVALIVHFLAAYKPVITFHGINGNEHDFDRLKEWTEKYHPGQLFLLNRRRTESVFMNLPYQVLGLAASIERMKAEHNFTSHHLLCHSQGALVCRAYLQSFDHSCENFISLSGPQMGQFGATLYWENYMPFLRNLSTHEAHTLFYMRGVQYMITVANFWNDPWHHEEFLRESVFLPKYNYEKNEQFKQNFMKLKLAVFYGSPGDEVIEPWESAVFGFFNTSKPAYDYQMLTYRDQEVYTQDYFGLRTMGLQNRVIIKEIPNVNHGGWIFREDIFADYSLPYLT